MAPHGERVGLEALPTRQAQGERVTVDPAQVVPARPVGRGGQVEAYRFGGGGREKPRRTTWPPVADPRWSDRMLFRFSLNLNCLLLDRRPNRTLRVASVHSTLPFQ
jgi:hypothetical protein